MRERFFKFFILLMLPATLVKAQVVTVDNYFNHETRKNASGQQEDFHYLWDDKTNGGFSIWGDIWKANGAQLKVLKDAPALSNLQSTNIYIIVDPDTRKESPHPNYIEPKDIEEIAKWVKNGGILVMMANDSANVELPHFNNLAARFGMHFNNDLQNHVVDDAHFEDGAIITTGNPIFKTAIKVYLKDVCSIAISGPAKAALKNNNGAVIIATAKYSKGTVFAVGDPWLYNEYTNGRLPKSFENDKAADDVAKWLIGKMHK